MILSRMVQSSILDFYDQMIAITAMWHLFAFLRNSDNWYFCSIWWVRRIDSHGIYWDLSLTLNCLLFNSVSLFWFDLRFACLVAYNKSITYSMFYFSSRITLSLSSLTILISSQLYLSSYVLFSLSFSFSLILSLTSYLSLSLLFSLIYPLLYRNRLFIAHFTSLLVLPIDIKPLLYFVCAFVFVWVLSFLY